MSTPPLTLKGIQVNAFKKDEPGDSEIVEVWATIRDISLVFCGWYISPAVLPGPVLIYVGVAAIQGADKPVVAFAPINALVSDQVEAFLTTEATWYLATSFAPPIVSR